MIFTDIIRIAVGIATEVEGVLIYGAKPSKDMAREFLLGNQSIDM